MIIKSLRINGMTKVGNTRLKSSVLFITWQVSSQSTVAVSKPVQVVMWRSCPSKRNVNRGFTVRIWKRRISVPVARFKKIRPQTKFSLLSSTHGTTNSIPVSETGNGIWGLCFSFSIQIMGYFWPSLKATAASFYQISWLTFAHIHFDVAGYVWCVHCRARSLKQVNKNVQKHTWGCMQKVKMWGTCFFEKLFLFTSL
jgi:hypothetical protein